MNATTTPSRTAAANTARRHRTQAALQRINEAIARLRREKRPISVAAVARRANVSRTFLYTNTDARSMIHATGTNEPVRDIGNRTPHDDARASTWRERALNAEEALKAARAEILTQRDRIAGLLGQIRDMQAEWTQDAIHRITTENTTLKQRVRQLAQDNRTLDERLAAARSTLRFQDRRLADLEAQLTDTVGQ